MAFQPHPFDPLSAQEIKTIAALVKSNMNEKVIFRVITLVEPPKGEMIAFLDASQTGSPKSNVTRKAMVHAYFNKAFHEIFVDIPGNKILSHQILEGKHSHVDAAYMAQVEEACMQDIKVQAEIEALKLPSNATVIVEPWTYATDGMNDMKARITMCWFYMHLRDHKDANYYAYPLDIVAEVSDNFHVMKLYRLPANGSSQTSTTEEAKPFDRRKIHSSSEYHPDLFTEHRNTTKPLHISQPQGPSFRISGNHISFENWTIRLGFNYREGMTLHDVRYDNRSIFYRLSLSEMFVPYGDPRAPYPRKGAFDLGNDGAGVNANNLKLGCDCLGHIKYFDFWHTTSDGDPLKMPNVVCCHEQDDGILWKHTNFRTGNGVVTRSRVLVLQTIITVSNYEYVFAFYFGQDASIHYEVRATGILSTAPIEVGGQVPYGAVVAPGVLAPYHQHLFCLRIDPALDGHENSLAVEDSVAMPYPNPENTFGVGYTAQSAIVEHEQGLDLDHTKNRTFKIINENRLNSITGTPIGYKLLPYYSQPILAHPSSFHARRSEFGAHAVWVTRYHDSELYAAGTHTLQSIGGDGIASWITSRNTKAESAVRNTDIVLWHTFGSTHNPRTEDWPVMPCEKMVVGLKPVNFFERNPGLDVKNWSQGIITSCLQPTLVLAFARRSRAPDWSRIWDMAQGEHQWQLQGCIANLLGHRDAETGAVLEDYLCPGRFPMSKIETLDRQEYPVYNDMFLAASSAAFARMAEDNIFSVIPRPPSFGESRLPELIRNPKVNQIVQIEADEAGSFTPLKRVWKSGDEPWGYSASIWNQSRLPQENFFPFGEPFDKQELAVDLVDKEGESGCAGD
ncbi:hypothetical protein DM02DRAFT_675343 [Periconia macrospinosa]|uniref:Amine oxidase n=1 Tax=Periconia macrospinosa TaxID=97972 RepID=A0A2V1DC62_9PLEO|nr:hypothetical protein DM02DRAFT_675343 [Periconia macrospinosa]